MSLGREMSRPRSESTTTYVNRLSNEILPFANVVSVLHILSLIKHRHRSVSIPLACSIGVRRKLSNNKPS